MLQLYLRAENAEAFALSGSLDLGDIVWAHGPLFRTRKGKRALLVEDIQVDGAARPGLRL